MPRGLTLNSRTRLAVAVALVAAIALAAVGWFARQSVVQERELTRLVLAERLEQTATMISREVDAELGRWELLAASVEPPRTFPAGATMVRFTADAVIEVHGERLPFFPAVPAFEEPDDERLRIAERAERADRDVALAIATYQDASTSTVRDVRATALAGLGRCLRAQKRTAEALTAYEDLARAANAQVDGVPAPFVARQERLTIYTGLGDTASADRERNSLAKEMRAATQLVNRATFDAFARALAPGAIPESLVARSATLVDFWPRWQQAPSGRIAGGTGPGAAVALWRPGPDVSTAIIAPVDTLFAASLATAERLSVSIALEDAAGEPVWGGASPGVGSVTRSLGDIGLPVTMRVSLQGEAERTDGREILFMAAFALLAIGVAIAAYAVFRSVPS
jgi:hypothetical protein